MLHRATRAAAGLLAAACVSICLAQQDAVVVEATRFPEDVRRLPASTTVITAEDIQRSAARTLPELLTNQVGVTMQDLYGNNGSGASIDLRGWGATGAQNALILLDGRRVNDIDLGGVQWSSIPLVQIERIEILRGTGAVLYGEGASSGVINIVTRSPLKAGYGVEAYGRIASYYTKEGQLYGSWANERLGVNGSVYSYDSDGYRQNNRNEQTNMTFNSRLALGEGALDFRAATDNQDLRLPGARRIQPSTGLNEYATDRRGAQTPLDYSSRDGARAGLGLTQRWGRVEFSAGLDYRNKDQRSYFDQSGFPDTRNDKLEFTSFTPRMRVPFDTGAVRHSLTVGLDWNYWSWSSRRTNLPENINTPTNRVSIKQETTGLYAMDSVDLTSSTIATAGYRVARAKYTGDDVVDPNAPGCTFGCSAAPNAHTAQNQSAWELGLRQAFATSWAAYGRIGKSFRLVNADEIYENNAAFEPRFQYLNPQTSKTYETGIEWRGQGSSARAALFQSDVHNEIHLDNVTFGVGNTNLPSSRRQGFELDGRWQATEGLLLNAGYTYTDAHFLEGSFAGSPVSFATDIPLAGKRVPLVPRHKVNAGLSWDFAKASRFSANWTGVSSMIMDNDESNTLGTQIPRWYSLDLKLAQKFEHFRIALMVNNALNQGYYTYAVRSVNAVSADRYAVYPLAGRTMGISGEIFLP